MDVFERIKKIIEEGRKFDHRRLFVVYGSNKAAIAAKIISLLPHPLKLLYVSHSLEIEKEGKDNFQTFKKVYGRDFDSLIFPETETVLGTTYDAVVLDLTHQLVPNDIGILVEVVRGGGILVFMTPKPEEWSRVRTFFQKKLVVHPYKLSDLKPRFIQRFVRKLEEHRGICFVDADKLEIRYNPVDEEVFEDERIELPKDKLFSENLYSLCKTNDQIKVLKHFERFYEKPKTKNILILTANRGRGKSAALGLGIAGFCQKLRNKKRVRVIVTAPQFLNAKTVFEFLQLGFSNLGINHRKIEFEGKISSIEGRNFTVEFWNVNKLFGKKCDLLVVDEAAGIPVPILFKLLNVSDRIVFSSTIHGYEGAGRGFSVRFMKKLRENKEWVVEKVEMKTPIRYGKNDPIERWLYDSLLLDAEPVALTKSEEEQAMKHRVKYVLPDLDRWFSEEEKKLRQFIGIYVLAHYRNRPNDVEIIGEAPHHKIRTLELKNGKIICSLQIAEEGGFEEKFIKKLLKGYEPQGHIIPDRIVKHYRIPIFGKFRGLRIVRIAVHPSLFGKGLGSLMLRRLEKEFKTKVDWIGASFGASFELLKFWIKNGYVPLHLSPDRNPVSGEYSCIVVKPLKDEMKEVMDAVEFEFKLRILNSLQDTYFDLEPEISRLLFLKPVKKEIELSLTNSQRERLKMYLKGPIDYEACDDAIREVVKYYFLKKLVKLTELQEKILITRVLKGKNWEETAKELAIGPKFCVVEVREIMRKICKKVLK